MTSATDSFLVFTVEPREAGHRLDHVLATRLAGRPELSRSRLQGLIRQGQVLVCPEADSAAPAASGSTGSGSAAPAGGVKPGSLLKLGDRVELRLPPPTATELVAEEISFPVLYEDDFILVLNKPPGLVVHPAGGNWQGTLVHGLLHHCRSLSGISGELRPGIVHRLDKDTSGCLVVAKNDLAHRHLLRQFKGKEVEKEYLALVRGLPAEDAGRVDRPLGRHPVNRKKMAVVKEGGREAVTHWRVRQRFAAAGCTLLVIGLETGRTHQIRVHLASLGHPLAGDRLYGRPHEADPRWGIERQWLHARQLAFRHPEDERRLRFTAPLWEDLEASLAKLQAAEAGNGAGQGLLVGVTGGIAAGKSRVTEYLARRGGFARLDVDQLARQLLAQGQPGWLALQQHYGGRFFTPEGKLDRPLLRRAIFADAALRAGVDRLLHPLIRRFMREQAADLFRAGNAVVLVEVPLLYEAGWQDDFDLVLAVLAEPELCRRRLQKRDRVSPPEADQAVAAQLPPEEKARRADMMIDNSGDWGRTQKELDRLLPRLEQRVERKKVKK